MNSLLMWLCLLTIGLIDTQVKYIWFFFFEDECILKSTSSIVVAAAAAAAAFRHILYRKYLLFCTDEIFARVVCSMFILYEWATKAQNWMSNGKVHWTFEVIFIVFRTLPRFMYSKSVCRERKKYPFKIIVIINLIIYFK